MNRILAVDDDRYILKVLKANLELQSYEVDTADTWETATKIISEILPDLILLDVMLPDGDGVEICRELKKDLPQIPVIMLTAKDTFSDKVISLESGADDYLEKPFETLELIARIKSCLRRVGPTVPDESVTIKNIKIYCRKRLVTASVKDIDLTPRAF